MKRQFQEAEVLDLLRDLVALPSPYFEEEEVLAYVEEWFSNQGLEVKSHYFSEDALVGYQSRNLLIRLRGQKEGPKILLNGHLDTVKKTQGWTKNPRGQLEGRRFYGQGALDMKGGCVASMLALAAFYRDQPHFRGEVLATYVPAEEGPYGLGTHALVLEDQVGQPDMVLVTEPSAAFTGQPFPSLCLGARGGYSLEIEVKGKAAHGANPQLGINAIEEGAKIILALGDLDFKEDPLLGRGNLCALAMEADGGACSIPDGARIRFFRHTVRGETEETVRKEIQEALDKAQIRADYKVHFRQAPSPLARGFMPYAHEAGDPRIQDFIGQVKKTTGQDPSLSYFQSMGDFNYFGALFQAPTLLFGPQGGGYHGPDEYVDLDSLVATSQVLYDYLVRVLVED
ncbi:MAG: M20/M25/M40 family metallo-hydrolase [Tissierellia bacterium]|nr:M20/M25/M40 family metallo-hydrolase [Tissierellia bacterium]